MEEIKLHPTYAHNPDFLHNDIALIKLSNKVNFNREIAPICLPKKGKNWLTVLFYFAINIYLFKKVSTTMVMLA